LPYRTFADATGAEWQVWDIVPRLSERRLSHPDRRIGLSPIAFKDRRRDGRRFTNARRSILRGTYALGWLCFNSTSEKRRLSPIPTGWTTCSDEALELYARQAELVLGQRRTFTFSGEGPLAEAG
jgi:hypothetical protein